MLDVELSERRSATAGTAPASRPRSSLEVPEPAGQPGQRPGRELGQSLISSTPWRRHDHSLVPVQPNPFRNDAAWTGWEVFKTAVAAVTLLPLRLIGILVCVLLAFLPMIVVSIGQPMEYDRGCLRHTVAFRGWRRLLMGSSRLAARLIALCMGFWHIRILDRRKDPSRRANILVISPHLGLVDAVLVAAVFSPMPCFLGRTEMAIPPAYFFACASQTVLVNLKKKESKQSCKDAIAFRASSAWDGPPLAIFPEGSVTNGQALTQFKVGAFTPGEPVTPILLRMPARGDWDPSWVGENRRHSILWFLRLMCQISNACSIEILDAYEPDEAERADPALYAANVRELMACELGVTITEHAYDDVFFYQEAALKARVQSDFTLASMKRLFDTDLDGLKRWLRLFQAADADRTGYLSREEMVQALGLNEHSDASVDRLFAFFDTDGSGSIEYREFVQAVALLSGKCSPASLAKLAFLICDREGTGLVAKNELLKTLDLGFAEPRLAAATSLKSRSSVRSSWKSSITSSTRSSAGSELLGSISAHGNAMLNFQDFARLVDQRPEVLDAALLRTRQRLSVMNPSKETA